MPRPATKRTQGKSTVAKFLSDSTALVSVVASLKSHASFIDLPNIQDSLYSFCSSVQQLHPQHGPLSNDVALSIVNHLEKYDFLAALTQLVFTLSPDLLLRSNAPGCSDPRCSDTACEPPNAVPVLLMAFNMATNLLLSRDDMNLQEKAYSKLVHSDLAGALMHLTETAAAALRTSPHSPDAVSGADQALATCLDVLQYFYIWVQEGGIMADDSLDPSTCSCVILARQLSDAGFVPRVCALQEALTQALVASQEAVDSLRTRGTDGALMRLIQVWCILDRLYPEETSINAGDMPVLYDCAFRMAVRTSLKLGSKLPDSVTASAASLPTLAGGLTPVKVLRPHWLAGARCRGLLVEAVRACCSLLQLGVPGEAGRSLVSLPMARTALAAIRLAAASKAEAASVQGDTCGGCVLMNLALQSCSLVTGIVLMLPRSEVMLLTEEATSLLVVMQVKAMGRSRGLPPSSSAAAATPVDECSSGDVDWVLADVMLSILLYAAGGPAEVLQGRLQRTAGQGGERGGQQASLLSHQQLHDVEGALAACGSAPASVPDAATAVSALPAKRLLRCIEGLLRVPAAPPQAAAAAGGRAGQQGLVIRAAHLGCLDLAALLYTSPEAWVGYDLVSLCASYRKHCSSLMHSPLPPDVAVELIAKGCQLLQAVIRGKDGIILPGQLESFCFASLHVLRACVALLLHMTGFNKTSSVSTPAADLTNSHDIAAADCPEIRMTAASAIRCCPVAVAESIAQLSKLCFMLIKVGVVEPIEATGVTSCVGMTLEQLVHIHEKGSLKGCNVGMFTADGLHLGNCKAGRPLDYTKALRRAAVWTFAHVMLHIHLSLCGGLKWETQLDGVDTGRTHESELGGVTTLLSERVLTYLQETLPGSLDMASALAGSAFIEFQQARPLAVLLKAVLWDTQKETQEQSTLSSSLDLAVKSPQPPVQAITHFLAACQKGANGAPSIDELGDAPLVAGLGDWAKLYVSRMQAEEAGGKVMPADAVQHLEGDCSRAWQAVKTMLMSRTTASLPARLGAHLGALPASELPNVVATAVLSCGSPTFSTNLAIMARMLQDSATEALKTSPFPTAVASTSMGQSSNQTRMDHDIGTSDADVTTRDAMSVAAAKENAASPENGSHLPRLKSEREGEGAAESAAELLQAEGSAEGLVGGLVLAGLRAGTLVAAASLAGRGVVSDALGSVPPAEAKEAVNSGGQQADDHQSKITSHVGVELLSYLRALEDHSTRTYILLGSKVVGWQAHATRFLVKASSEYGCYVGCNNPVCQNMDKMSESGLELKDRGKGFQGIFCSDICATRAGELLSC
ncbi:hypothetical protein CEUSTIGMA_g7405.t1 [Chlamydomonas eustigma]|uniref:Uncharacterized protein n=1 Tax=Chlamydomonas eustigma TaxID=1157962 RepID=A0A250XA93_9CHLO|nr:hypothetical protein CEUSTIGMA_g7405.t1 [Chlamydomonas eustigma]|eukprot:GAX79966.1 hypothetical protein CEUSTIGMA_g7405.t1 [Chlamydomonas eustigma]